MIATLPDGYELHRLIRVPAAAGGDDPSVLAVRAVELLRDIYLDVPRDFPHREAPKPRAGAAAAGRSRWSRRRSGPRITRRCACSSARRCWAGGAGWARRSRPCSAWRFPSAAACRWRGRRRVRSAGWSATRRPVRRRRRRRSRWSAGATSWSCGAASVRSSSLATGVHYIRAEGTPALEKAPIAMSSSAIAPLFAFGAGRVGLVPALARRDRAGRGVLHAADDGHRHQRHARRARGRAVVAGADRAARCRSASASSVSAISTAATPSSSRWPGRGCGGGRRCGR